MGQPGGAGWEAYGLGSECDGLEGVCVPKVTHPTLCPGRRGKARRLLIGHWVGLCNPGAFDKGPGSRNPTGERWTFMVENRQLIAVCARGQGRSIAGQERPQGRAPFRVSATQRPQAQRGG